MVTLLLFIIVLSLLVFVHELGHFVMAKRMGMKVEEFGFGFPPRAWGVKRGETTYSINWIPLGGFVKIKGESGEQAHDTDSFASKKAWKRFVVLIAGVAMNLVLAAVLFSIGYMSGLPSIIDESLPASARIESRPRRPLRRARRVSASSTEVASDRWVRSLRSVTARAWLSFRGP